MDSSSPSTPPEAPAATTTSLGARLLNVYAAPSEAFDQVRTGPPATGNWLVPVLLSCVIGVALVWIVFSQDTILRAIREAQEKQIQKLVDSGKLKKEQAEAAMSAIDRFASPTILKIGGAFGVVASSFGFLFLIALGFWLVGNKGFKAQFTYMQAVEACGLASMVQLLGSVVSSLLIVIMGNLQASPGPVLFLHDFDPANKLHLLLRSLNVMTLWYVGVLAVGLSRLSRASFGKAALWVYGLWVGLTLLIVLPGWGR